MLITEELFLLLTTDDGKTEGQGTRRGYGLSGAVLADLACAERVTFGAEKDPRVTVCSAAPTGNPVLDGALRRVADKDGTKLSKLIQDRKLDPADDVIAALHAQGVIGIEEGGMFGLRPDRHPVLDPAPERAIRERLRTCLAGGSATAADATLLSILQGLEVAHRVLAQESGGLGKRELKARIEAIAADSDTGSGVARAVKAMNQAIMVAVIIPVVTSSAGS